jgi:hypothetical protein
VLPEVPYCSPNGAYAELEYIDVGAAAVDVNRELPNQSECLK